MWGEAHDAIPGDGTVHVVIRRVCESLGIDHSAQLARLKRSPWACVVMMATQMPGDDQVRSLASTSTRCPCGHVGWAGPGKSWAALPVARLGDAVVRLREMERRAKEEEASLAKRGQATLFAN